MTPVDDRAIDLLLEWEERRKETPNLALEDICVDQPTLLAVAKQHLAIIESVDAVLGNASDTSPRVAFNNQRLVLLKQLGEGGMGEVYLADDVALERRVAVKFPKWVQADLPTVRQRFVREARLLAALQHPNIVAVYAAELAGDQSYLVMEYVSGGSLAGRRNEAFANPEWVVTILEQTARAVDYAHKHGILHRDLKPSNILLDEAGQPKVADFGVASLFTGEAVQTLTHDTPHERTVSTQITATGRAAGTAAYTAPELLNGNREGLSPASDVWSLGVVAYELLSGQLPFPDRANADTAPLRLRAIRPQLDRGLDRIVMRCLAPQPSSRYPTAEHLARALGRWRVRRRLRRFGKRYVLPTMLLVFALAGIVALCWPASPETIRRQAQRAIQVQLQQGKTVTLIGVVGSPKGHLIPVGAAYTRTVVNPDGTFSVAAGRPAFVELVENIEHENYRITADIREDGFFGDAVLGLYFAHQVLTGNPEDIHASCCVYFADFGPQARQSQQPGALPLSLVKLDWLLFPHLVTTGNDWISYSGRSQRYAPPTPVDPLPGPWRSISVTVGATSALAFFNGQQIESEMTLKEAQTWAKLRLSRDPRLAGKNFQPSHRGGAGVFVSGCEASFRNFCIEPLTKP